ncbi:hypothetical protein K7432_006282 [Basidiobolus ranarum]|uniref:F-box domain-containing protein n=1 Tax=Basidiobolus ranarum TaxID=34480 RepID=A0ABR2W2N3_9FUNG
MSSEGADNPVIRYSTGLNRITHSSNTEVDDSSLVTTSSSSTSSNYPNGDAHFLVEALLDTRNDQPQCIFLSSFSETSPGMEVLRSSELIKGWAQISVNIPEPNSVPFLRKESIFEEDNDISILLQQPGIEPNDRGKVEIFPSSSYIPQALQLSSNMRLDLPDELMLNIFQYISFYQTVLLTCAEVSRQWNRCVTPFLYHFPRFESTFHWAMFLQTLLRPTRLHTHGTFVRNIDLSPGATLGGNICVSASSIVQLCEQCPRLQYLNLSGCSIIPDIFYPEINEYQSTLQHVPHSGLICKTISTSEVIQAIGERCTQIEYMNLSGCEWMCIDNLLLLAKYCKKLKLLDLRKCEKIYG